VSEILSPEVVAQDRSSAAKDALTWPQALATVIDLAKSHEALRAENARLRDCLRPAFAILEMYRSPSTVMPGMWAKAERDLAEAVRAWKQLSEAPSDALNATEEAPR
jgi:hypothetical protein